MVTINNSDFVRGSWGAVDKSALGEKLAESGNAGAIHEAYLFVGDVEKRSTWKFPHHVLQGDTLKPHVGGVHAAAQRLVSSGATASSIPKKAAARHLLKHYKAMGEEAPESLSNLSKYVDRDEALREINMLQKLSLHNKSEQLLEWIQDVVSALPELPVGKEKAGPEVDLGDILAALEEILDYLAEEEEEEEGGTHDPTLQGRLDPQPISQPHFSPEFQYGPSAVPGGIPGHVSSATPADSSLGWETSKALAVAKRKGLPIAPDGNYAVKNMSLGFSNKGKKTREDYRPIPEELDQINKYSNVDLNQRDCYSFSCMAADTNPDAQYDIIEPSAHSDGAYMAPDQPILTDHEWKIANQIGKIYAAEAPGDGLYLKFYVMDTPENKHLLENLFGGVHNKVSIGFNTKLKDIHCSACSHDTSIYSDMCPHEPGMVDTKMKSPVYSRIKHMARFNECSLVTVPAQYKAGIRRNQEELMQEGRSPVAGQIDPPVAGGFDYNPLADRLPGEPPRGRETQGVPRTAVLSAPEAPLGDEVSPAKSGESTDTNGSANLDIKGSANPVSTIPSDHTGKDDLSVNAPQEQKEIGKTAELEVGPGPINEVGSTAGTSNVRMSEKPPELMDNHNEMDVQGLIREIRDLMTAIRESFAQSEERVRYLIETGIEASAKSAKTLADEQLENLKKSQEATDQRLEVLQGIVEMAASCTVQQIERDLIVRNGSKAAEKTSSLQSILPLIKGQKK